MVGKPGNISHPRLRIAVLWLLNLASIPLLSCFGRPLQRSLQVALGAGPLAWILGILVALALFLAGRLLYRRLGWPGLIHLAWMVGFSAVLMIYVGKYPARWLHIPLFGAFGFLSVRLFTLRTGTEVALALSVLDEILQHYLPDRKGDPEDMLINALCALVGLIFYLILRRTAAKNRVSH